MVSKELLIEKIHRENKTNKLVNIDDIEITLNYLNLSNKNLLKLLLEQKNTLEYLNNMFSAIKGLGVINEQNKSFCNMQG